MTTYKGSSFSMMWIDDDSPLTKRLTLAIRIALFGLLLLTLAACRKDVRPVAVEEGCDALCRTPCETSVPVWNPPGGGLDESDWDTYPEQVTIPLKGKADTCELHRTSCVQCLDRLKAAGATR